MQVREIPNRIRAHFPARNSANRVLCVLPRFPLVEFTSDLFSRTLVNCCDESSLCLRVQHLHLDAYRAAIKYVGWAYCYCECLKGHRHAKDRLPRASQSIPLNI